MKLCLILVKHHVWGREGTAPQFLNLDTLSGDEWLASRSDRFSPGTHWIRRWVVTGAGLNAIARKNSPVPPGDRTPVVQPPD